MSKTCFVVSPIGDEGSKERKHANNVYNFLIKPVCEKNDLNPLRIDQKFNSDMITSSIFHCLDTYDLVIVDISFLNPNVMFEYGYRFSKGKKLVAIKDKNLVENFPFDIKDIDTMHYSLEPDDIFNSVELLNQYVRNTLTSGNRTFFSKTIEDTTVEIVREEDGSVSLDVHDLIK